MIRGLAENVVNWQINRHFIKEEERGLYLYGYEILFNQVINILIAIVLAVLFCAPMQIFIFLASYIPLRMFCGGHHANTNEGCTVVSAVLICIVCITVRFLPDYVAIILQPISYIISGIMIIFYAPVEDVNKPLTKEEVKRYRKMSGCVWLTETFIGIILIFFSNSSGVIIALSHTILCIMLYLGVRKNKKSY